jgi:creatinine amidohydrolase
LENVSGHGGNTVALHYAARQAAIDTDLAVIIIDWWKDVAVEARRELFKRPGHAGEDETSAMLAMDESIVDLSSADYSEAPRLPITVYHRKSEEIIYSKALTGDARLASREKGEKWLHAVVNEISLKILEAMKSLGLRSIWLVRIV